LKNANLILKDEISSNTRANTELKDKKDMLEKEVLELEKQIIDGKNQISEYADKLSKTREEEAVILLKMKENKSKQDAIDSDNKEKTKQLKDKESDIYKREQSVLLKEKEYSGKISKLTDFISKL